MSRNFKALGLAMVAALALSAVAASAAQATNHHLQTAAPAIITANDEAAAPATLTTGGGEIRCKDAKYEGTVTAEKSTEVTVNATYAECTNETTGQSATVKMNHCAYILTGTTDANGDAKTHLECAEGSQIEITTKIFFSTCTIDIKAQTPGSGVHYTETTNASTGKKDVTVSLTVTGITYTITPNSFPCNEFGNGEDGSLGGGVTSEAFADKESCSALSGTERTTPGSHFTNCEGSVQDLKLGAT